MFEFLGETYYIDLKKIDKILISDSSFEEGVTPSTEITTYFDAANAQVSKEIIETEHYNNKEINGVRYEIIRGFITDLGESEITNKDEIGRIKIDELSIRFKLAFNTLLFYNILKKLD